MLYRFGDCEVDLDLYELRRAGMRQPVEPQVFDVLVHLIRHRDRLVTKDELLDAVWGSRFVSESALTSRVKAARRAVGDDGRLQAVIHTAHGRGYRFVAPLREIRGEGTVGGDTAAATAADTPGVAARVRLPSPLTPFIGRSSERAELAAAVRAHRLVTATGPGGVGKTRLAVAAASDVGAELSGAVVFVDLVRVTQPEMVEAAVADAAGVPERAGAGRLEALIAALGEGDCLVVMDNCEHVQDAARRGIEQLLLGCPGVRVLATSRLRLMLPFEHVVAVPGLSLEGSGGSSDAVRLFVDRMVAAGAAPPVGAGQWEGVAEICGALEGIALAIELAAARVPGLGLDGLAGALGSRLDVLAIGHRAEDRHRSLRAAIDWSYSLLSDDERAVLRAASVFAAPFDAEAMAAVTGRTPAAVLDPLARLVDWNLLTLRTAGLARYRVLETIRQFALERAEAGGDAAALHGAHLAWCQATLEGLLAAAPGDDRWCGQVDLVLDDARAALAWASEPPGERRRAIALAAVLADVSFQRGLPGEAQRRYQQAATGADTPAERRRWLRLAAGAAAARNVGGDAVDLLQQAAAVAVDAGEHDAAAFDLASAAALAHRAPGIMHRPVPEATIDALLDRARAMSRGTPEAEAAVAVAEGWGPRARARSRDLTERALERAEAADQPLLVDDALDQVTALELDAHDLNAAAAAIDRRLGVLGRVPLDALSGFEYYDAYQMACRVSLAAGRLGAARRHADAVASLPFLREQRHIGLGRRMEVDALAGDFDTVINYSHLFERDWRQAGRPVAGNLAPGGYAAAMVYGMVGDGDGRARWIGITRGLLSSPERLDAPETIWRFVLDAFLALHVGDPHGAGDLLTDAPDDHSLVVTPNHPVWVAWYAAAWAEASVLADHPDASARLDRAAHAAVGNEIALTIIRRARLLHERTREGFGAIADRFATLACPYQEARTRSLARS